MRPFVQAAQTMKCVMHESPLKKIMNPLHKGYRKWLHASSGLSMGNLAPSFFGPRDKTHVYILSIESHQQKSLRFAQRCIVSLYTFCWHMLFSLVFCGYLGSYIVFTAGARLVRDNK